VKFVFVASEFGRLDMKQKWANYLRDEPIHLPGLSIVKKAYEQGKKDKNNSAALVELIKLLSPRGIRRYSLQPLL
jgi:hypothetical protein